MKKILLLLPLFAVSLTSCGVNYELNKFFSNSLLSKEGIPNLPVLEGKKLRVMSAFDNITKTVYIQNSEARYSTSYVQSVYDYLRGLSFKHFYTVDKNDFLLTWSLTEKEITSIEDCKYQDNLYIYSFFVSNNDEYQNDSGSYFIDGLGIKIITSGGTTSYYNKDFKFDVSITLCTNENWNFCLSER